MKRSGLDAFGFIAKRSKKITGPCVPPVRSASLGLGKLLVSETNVTEEGGFEVFCDLDGVLVDFDSGVRKIFNGRGPDDISSQGQMWAAISRQPSFYADLPWTKDGRDLWNAIKHLRPNILTGVPRTKKSRQEKVAWCTRELGVQTNHVDMAGKKSSHERVEGRIVEGVVNVITCWSKNKHHESRDGAVLIDDRESLGGEWRKKGGIFIHHTSSTTTIEKLIQLGIIKQEKDQNTPDVIEILE
uniref:Uncharacterized protein n=1 Tax=Trieres chinensis TaxID=1514140 RepID=A0A7S2EM95_TRICV|mmetsp:Transcript_30278/g.61739  ORF Transcript_30278/g.61739 Transcript_30278/m.61739 type:complete len:243 (+) Transcript_30278:93-821(+)